MNYALFYLILSTVFPLPFSALDQDGFKENWESRVDSLILAQFANDEFDGTIVIGNQEGILYQKALGVADRTWNVPIAPDTRFDIASLNKSFQAALILMATEEGLISLDDKLIRFFPDLKFDTTITLHHLLTHTSGLPDYDAVSEDLREDNFRAFKRLHFEKEDYVRMVSELEVIASPGLHFHYSNFGYHLLAIILEKVYQRPFPQILEEKICQPFGLEHTFSGIENERIHPNVATGYNYDTQDSCYKENNFIDLTLGRRIFSTSADLFQWSRLLSSGGIISPASYQLMTTNHLDGISRSISYGYGFVVFDGGKYRMGDLDIPEHYVIHGGATEGYKAMLTNVNSGELIIAHLSNIGDRTNELQLTKTIVHLILD